MQSMMAFFISWTEPSLL